MLFYNMSECPTCYYAMLSCACHVFVLLLLFFPQLGFLTKFSENSCRALANSHLEILFIIFGGGGMLTFGQHLIPDIARLFF